MRLGINTGFALNRFSSPEEWIPLVSQAFGLKLVQFTADLLSPSLPDPIIRSQIKKINKLKNQNGLIIKSTFTSAFTRLNHLAHPDKEIRQYWQKWFCRFVDISVDLGAENMGSHLGIFTVKDYSDHKNRAKRFKDVVEGWHKISKYAKKRGLKYLTWEPMSIGREMGETISEAKRIHHILNKNLTLPIKMCLDVDHGDVSSPNPLDVDPYAWLEACGPSTAMIHLKQSSTDKGGHWPFTVENNAKGKIIPQKIISSLKKAGVNQMDFFLELSFREREPFESRLVKDMKESVDYWRRFIEV